MELLTFIIMIKYQNQNIFFMDQNLGIKKKKNRKEKLFTFILG